jgi:4-hydroxy-3-polyprenylbenzoate decarboxylase|tara:strand:+ start:533 stop:1108 length:576 start_codon:yes stop_codon:yes gene_type:complete
MIKNKHKIIVSVSGASGSIYAKVLFDKLVQLKEQIEMVGVLMSDNAKYVWETELNNSDYNNYPFTFYDKMDFMAPFASGSANYGTMIICPCSMGTMGRIATGISNDLTTRAADVILKERRKLIIVARETPLSLIHINNMKIITEAGGIICPATPSFYSKPQTFEALAATVIDRVLTLSDLQNDSYSWGAKQ